MPNKYGFQRLGDTLACIDCDVREPAYRWPEKRQLRHQEAHAREAAKATERMARQRAREARRLAAQLRRENGRAYGS